MRVRNMRPNAAAIALAWLGLGIVINSVTAGAVPERVTLRPMKGPDGQAVDLRAPKNGATAIVFYSSECPISNAYSPTLNRLLSALPPGRVRIVGVCVDPDLSDADIATHAKDFGLKYPVVRDPSGSLSARIGATVTPEVFVIDDQGRIRYHGRIDDQFAGRQKPNANPAANELQDALVAVLDGREPAVKHVDAVGCPIPEPVKPKAVPTYAKEVSRILQKNCQECHRKGQVGPFALENYEQARKRAQDIASVVEDRAMPPWKPVPGIGPKFKHDRSLAASDIARLVAWAAGGAPEGDKADLPPPLTFTDEWALGTPDLVITPAEDFNIPAEGADIYRCFVVPTNLPDDVFISAIEYRPGNRQVVHHMLSYVDVKGEARKRDEKDPGPGYACFSGPEVEIHGDLGGWAPGNEPSRLPDGIGRSLPKGADVIMQLHYHPSGKPETDRSRIGLHFSRKPIKQILHWNAAINIDGLKLPPGESNIEIKAAWPVPVDLQAHGVTPHMHMLGRDMLMSVSFPDGTTRDLVKIDDWDFGWQNTYFFDKPLDLPKGSVVRVVAHYDNTSSKTTARNLRISLPPPQAREVGRSDHRRDVYRLHRRHQGRPGPDPAR